jgi:hypothetical protein
VSVHGWMIVGLALHAAMPSLAAEGFRAPTIHGAKLGEPGQKTEEISTEELRRIVADKSRATSVLSWARERLREVAVGSLESQVSGSHSGART